MPKTKPRRGSYTMRFAKLGGQIIAFTTIRKHIGGEGKGKHPRVRLFSGHSPLCDLKPEEFQDMIQEGRIQQLDLPYDLREDAESISERIGEEYTPQEALSILNQMLQDHPTTLNAEVVDHG